jgi:hypothetical protein
VKTHNVDLCTSAELVRQLVGLLQDWVLEQAILSILLTRSRLRHPWRTLVQQGTKGDCRIVQMRKATFCMIWSNCAVFSGRWRKLHQD